MFNSSSSMRCSSSSSTPSSLADILDLVQTGAMNPKDAEKKILESMNNPSVAGRKKKLSPEEAIQSFANLDHTRSFRTGFPEVVFAETKTPKQVAMIMDDMARHVNESIQKQQQQQHLDNDETTRPITAVDAAILATRVTPEMNAEIAQMSFDHGTVTYDEQARILSMKASALDDITTQQLAAADDDKPRYAERCVVATAGTTDLPVAEEAAIVLEAAGCEVDRIYDVGVAGLHRIVGALPRLRDEKVGAVIVCAGMDGALPSVVGGLVGVPVFAVPTSVGYGVSLGGVAAMLTMLNSCAPGVSVLNVDNGFGAATCAFKIIKKSKL